MKLLRKSFAVSDLQNRTLHGAASKHNAPNKSLHKLYKVRTKKIGRPNKSAIVVLIVWLLISMPSPTMSYFLFEQ